MFESIKETLSSAYDSVKSTVSEAIDEVTEAASNAVDTVSDAVSSLGDNSLFSNNTNVSTQDVIEYIQEAETPDYQAAILEGDDELASAEQSYVQAQNQNQVQEQSLVSTAINWVSDKVEETLGASVSDIATEIKNDVIEAADNFLFSKASAAPVNEEAIQRETGEIQYTPAYTNDERLEKTDNEIRVVKVQEWNSSANSNDSLERIIENSYDLKALGIEYGSKEYIDLENKIMAMNPEIFAKDGINSVLYDNDKIKLPVVGYKKVKNEKTETKEPPQKEDEIKKAAFEKELSAKIEKEERELKAQQQSGGGIDKIATFFGWESKEEKAIADKKAALEKAMKSDNIQDKIAAYKLINNLNDKSDEEISNLIEAQQKQSLETKAIYDAMKSGVFEFGGKTVSMEEITSIVGEQISSNGRDVQNAYERQGWFSKGLGNINDYIGIGTTNDNIKAQYELQQQMLQELQNCKNPVEYAAKFKQITGQDFNAQSIMQLMAYKHAGEEIPSSEPKQGKIDLSVGVKEITDTLGDNDKDNLSLIKDTKLSETIEEYKGTQEAVLDGAIAVGTGVLMAATAPVGLAAGVLIGAGISTGVHIADSYYDSDGDGKSEFNYELKNLPVDLGLGALNGMTGGIAGVGKAILVKTAGKQIGKKAVSTALRTLPQGVNAAEATAKETLNQTIKNSATKVTTNLMAHAIEDYANGAIYSAADYSLRTLTDENKEFNLDEALEHAHQGGEAGILFGGALRGSAKAVSSANKFFKKSKTDTNEPVTPSKSEALRSEKGTFEEKPIKPTKPDNENVIEEKPVEKEPVKPTKTDKNSVIEETAPKNTQNVFQDVDAIFKKEDEILKQFADTGFSPKAEIKAAKELEEQLDNLYQKYKNLPDGAEKQKLAEMIKLRNEYHYADLGLYTNNSELKNKLDNILGEINAAEQKVKTANIKDKTDNNVTEIKEEVKSSKPQKTEPVDENVKSSEPQKTEPVDENVKSSEPQKTEPVDENVKSSETNKGDEVLDTDKTVKERAKQAYKSAKDTVLDAKKTVQEKANQVYEGVKDTAASAKDKVSGAIKSAKEKAGQVYDKAQSAAASVREKAGNLADSAGDAVLSARDKAKGIVNNAIEKAENLAAKAKGKIIPANHIITPVNEIDFRIAPAGSELKYMEEVYINSDAKVQLKNGKVIDFNSSEFKNIKDGDRLLITPEGKFISNGNNLPFFLITKIGNDFFFKNWAAHSSAKLISAGTSNMAKAGEISRFLKLREFCSPCAIINTDGIKNLAKILDDTSIESLKSETDCKKVINNDSLIGRIEIKDGKIDYIATYDLKEIKTQGVAGVQLDDVFFNSISKLIHGKKLDSSLADYKIKVGNQDVKIMTDNNIVSEQWVKANGKIPQKGFLLPKDVEQAVDEALQQLHATGQKIPEKVYITDLFGTDGGKVAGIFSILNPKSILINRNSMQDTDFLKKVIYHETAHLQDWNLRDRSNWQRSFSYLSDKGIKISPMKDNDKFIDFNGKQIDKSSIKTLISGYSLTNYNEFVAEVSAMITEGKIYKTPEGHHMIQTDKNGMYKNAAHVKTKFKPERDGAILDDIMELYNHLTEGKIARPEVR